MKIRIDFPLTLVTIAIRKKNLYTWIKIKSNWLGFQNEKFRFGTRKTYGFIEIINEPPMFYCDGM